MMLYICRSQSFYDGNKSVATLVANHILIQNGKDSEKLVNAFLETVEGALLAGNAVKFIGFGSWEIKKREAREMTSFQTGKKNKD